MQPAAQTLAEQPAIVPRIHPLSRLTVEGKFLSIGNQKFHPRGVTYGPFNPLIDGCFYRNPDIVSRDFSMMHAAGINALRAYTCPPRWLLDLAEAHQLRVMVGIPWTQHVAFFDHAELKNESARLVEETMRQCADHPALLALAIGNEIPARIARWYGLGRIEKHLHHLFNIAKRNSPQTLITYANYPSTEYLQLPFLDFVSFNLYLNDPAKLQRYLARLHNLAGDRPVVISELGIDSQKHGQPEQARQVVQQIDTLFTGGAAGLFLFSWTDEWFHHGHDIHAWKFGLVDTDRKPRIARDAVAAAFNRPPVSLHAEPRVSVIICSYNGEKTIAQTIRRALEISYSNFEVIVVDDGCTDRTAAIAAAFPVRLIQQKNLGLSVARNTGLHAAIGEIVAYIDDDAYPDADWLTYLVQAMQQAGEGAHEIVGAGGPNLPVPADGLTADCIARVPGGPAHVLLTDTIAEHIPGCNMAFSRQALLNIGGFDPRFRIAGDDVDLCWRLQQAGGKLLFAPAAVVWHHRRRSVRAFWRQQFHYGKAEADLQRKWPEKYSPGGHLAWTGAVYGVAHVPFLRSSRIYHGVWCEAPFQHRQSAASNLLTVLPMTGEWYLLQCALLALCHFGWIWRLLLLGTVIFSASQAIGHAFAQDRAKNWRARLLIAVLYRLQPLARCAGRYGHGLTPWRSRGVRGFLFPRPRTITIGVSRGKHPTEWLQLAEQSLRNQGVRVIRGNDFDRFDLQITAGLFASIRVNVLTEEMGNGIQSIRWRLVPAWSRLCLIPIAIIAFTLIRAPLAAWRLQPPPSFTQAHPILYDTAPILSALILLIALQSAGAAMRTFARAVNQITAPAKSNPPRSADVAR